MVKIVLTTLLPTHMEDVTRLYVSTKDITGAKNKLEKTHREKKQDWHGQTEDTRIYEDVFR